MSISSFVSARRKTEQEREKALAWEQREGEGEQGARDQEQGGIDRRRVQIYNNAKKAKDEGSEKRTPHSYPSPTTQGTHSTCHQ